jgi:adenylate cyclase
VEIQSLLEWLINGVPGAHSAPEVVVKVCEGLRRAGVPLERGEAFVRTLHPHIVGRSFVWRPDRALEVREQSWTYLQSPEFTSSPIATVFRTGTAERRRIHDAIIPGEESFRRTLEAEQITDFIAEPIRFLSGQIHAITYATTRRQGFDAEHLQALRAIVPPLSRVAEILALNRTAANLLDTYVGHNAGERILAGHIKRGEVEPIHAVLWFSDLRGFTSLAAKLDPGALIRALNELFECQVPAIEKRGGEVLKFMGDGLLAIFPIKVGGRSIAELCDDALETVDEAHAALAALNQRRTGAGELALEFGLALHVGEIAYGNIGGAGRLDFTVIGPAVNLVARLEGLTSKLGKRVVLSEAVASATRRPIERLGVFELKGVPGVAAAFAPKLEHDE